MQPGWRAKSPAGKQGESSPEQARKGAGFPTREASHPGCPRRLRARPRPGSGWLGDPEDWQSELAGRSDIHARVVAHHHQRAFRPAELSQEFGKISRIGLGEMESLIGGDQGERHLIGRQSCPGNALNDRRAREKRVGGDRHLVTARQELRHQVGGSWLHLGQRGQEGKSSR